VCAGPSGIVGKAIVSLCDNLDMTYYRKSQRGCHTVPIFTVCGIWNLWHFTSSRKWINWNL